MASSKRKLTTCSDSGLLLCVYILLSVMVALMDFLALSLLQAENTVVHLAQEIALFCDITDMPQTKLGI